MPGKAIVATSMLCFHMTTLRTNNRSVVYVCVCLCIAGLERHTPHVYDERKKHTKIKKNKYINAAYTVLQN